MTGKTINKKIMMEGEWKEYPDEVIQVLIEKVYRLEVQVKELLKRGER